MIDVKTAAAENLPSSSAPGTACEASARTAETSTELAGVISPLLEIAGVQRAECVRTIPGDGHGFGRAVRRNAGHRHARGDDIVEGIAAGLLVCSIRCDREPLKSAGSGCAAIGPLRPGTGLPHAREEGQLEIRLHILMRSVDHDLLRAI